MKRPSLADRAVFSLADAARRAAERPVSLRTTIPPPGTITGRSSNPERRRLIIVRPPARRP